MHADPCLAIKVLTRRAIVSTPSLTTRKPSLMEFVVVGLSNDDLQNTTYAWALSDPYQAGNATAFETAEERLS